MCKLWSHIEQTRIEAQGGGVQFTWKEREIKGPECLNCSTISYSVHSGLETMWIYCAVVYAALFLTTESCSHDSEIILFSGIRTYTVWGRYKVNQHCSLSNCSGNILNITWMPEPVVMKPSEKHTSSVPLISNTETAPTQIVEIILFVLLQYRKQLSWKFVFISCHLRSSEMHSS
jgi:hypothetical protein